MCMGMKYINLYFYTHTRILHDTTSCGDVVLHCDAMLCVTFHSTLCLFLQARGRGLAGAAAGSGKQLVQGSGVNVQGAIAE